jgi:hypothetical protein
MMSSLGRTARIVTLSLASLLPATVAPAQTKTSGEIRGTVTQKSGQVPILNATIVAHNNNTNSEQMTHSDNDGNYQLINLAPGEYRVTISADTFATETVLRVVVEVGKSTEISAQLGASGKAETVEAEAKSPQINSTTPEISSVLNQVAISGLPNNGNRWSNFTLLTPGVVSDAEGNGRFSFRGLTPLQNNNNIDGVDNNQAFFSEERGRTRINYVISQTAIREFQVSTSNHSAENGGAGGVINAVTNSGTNAIHGSAYFYDRDNVWGATNPLTQLQVQTAPGVFTPTNFKPTDWRKMAGFGVGGPLIKDKLFLYIAYDWNHRNFPGVAAAANPSAFFAPINSSQAIVLANRLGVAPTQAIAIYNNDLAALNTMLGAAPREGDQNIFFPKLDWQINTKNHASFSFNRMRWNSPAGAQTQPVANVGIASFGSDFVKDTWGVAKLSTMVTNNFANELRFQYGRDFEFEFAQQPTPYEQANLVNTPTFTNPLGLPPSVSITNGFTFGVPTFLQRPAFPDETRQQYADTMIWTHGKHILKYGFDFSHVNDNQQNLPNQFGSYSYSSLIDYFSDLNKPNTCGSAGRPCYTGFTQSFGPLGLEFSTNDYAIFAEDDWKVLRRLSLSLGVRYEFEQSPTVLASRINALLPQTGKLPSDKNNFGPHVGFVAQLTGDGKTVLRGGYGLYYGRIINSTIFNALTNTGAGGNQITISLTPASSLAPTFPRILSAAPGFTSLSNVSFFDPHFQNPQIHQMDLTLERQIGWGTVLSASYLGSLGRELPSFVDINVPQNNIGSITYKVINGGPITTPTYTTVLFQPASPSAPRPNFNFGAMTNIFSGVNSSYHALIVQANHRLSHHIQFGASYTWSHAIDFGQSEDPFRTNALLFPNTIVPEKGNSTFNVPYRFVANAIINSPWKKTGHWGCVVNDWQLSPVVQVQEGLPYTLTVTGNAPGGAIGGINGSGGSNRIDVLGNNSFRLPMTSKVDLRLGKDFRVKENVRVRFTADFFNLLNKQNVTSVNQTGYSIVSSGTIPTQSGFVTCSPTSPCLSFNVNPTTFVPAFGAPTGINNNFLYTPREIQLGAYVSF